MLFNSLKIFVDPDFKGFSSIKSFSNLSILKGYIEREFDQICDIVLYTNEDRVTDEWVKLNKDIVQIKTLEGVTKKISEDLSISLEEDMALANQENAVLFVTEKEITQSERKKISEEYSFEVIDYKGLESSIEHFIHGFNIYFSFMLPMLNIDSPQIKHQMTSEIFNSFLLPIFNHFNDKNNNYTDDEREEVRSFVHNRFPDILTCIDFVKFYELQLKIGLVEQEEPPRWVYSQLRFYLNYYYYLLAGLLDHMAVILLSFHNFPDEFTDNKNKINNKIGFYLGSDNKKRFLNLLLSKNEEFYEYIAEDEFQDWQGFIRSVRDEAAHKNPFNPAPLYLELSEDITDEEIDEIIYNNPETADLEFSKSFPDSAIETKKTNDRLNYRISQMDIQLTVFGQVENHDGQNLIFVPVDQFDKDLNHVSEMVKRIASHVNN